MIRLRTRTLAPIAFIILGFTLILQSSAFGQTPPPVGSIIASMLTEAQFQRLAGTGWILGDGRAVPRTAYSRITGRSSIPDLRGMFLRGQNENRNDGLQNPELKQLGENQ